MNNFFGAAFRTIFFFCLVCCSLEKEKKLLAPNKGHHFFTDMQNIIRGFYSLTTFVTVSGKTWHRDLRVIRTTRIFSASSKNDQIPGFVINIFM